MGKEETELKPKTLCNPATIGKMLKNKRWELFCQFYVTKDFFGSGVEAYAEAYDKDLSIQGVYGVCGTLSSKLLKNLEILHRIDELMEHAVLNDQFVDREMAFVIQQKADLHAKIKGINEYNKVKKRVADGIIKVEGLAEVLKKALNDKPINPRRSKPVSKKTSG